jgi:hypothetical protein
LTFSYTFTIFKVKTLFLTCRKKAALYRHATERMLLQYIGETENDHLEDFMNVWGSETNEEKKIVKMA